MGSARASRAGDGALAIANFSRQACCGEAPQPAREARALPRRRLCLTNKSYDYRPPLRTSHANQIPRLQHRGNRCSRARYRREHCHVQRRKRNFDSAVAVSTERSAGHDLANQLGSGKDGFPACADQRARFSGLANAGEKFRGRFCFGRLEHKSYRRWRVGTPRWCGRFCQLVLSSARAADAWPFVCRGRRSARTQSSCHLEFGIVAAQVRRRSLNHWTQTDTRPGALHCGRRDAVWFYFSKRYRDAGLHDFRRTLCDLGAVRAF